MPGKPTTVAQYLAALPKDRRDALRAVRKVILANLDDGYAEGLQDGAISYHVPHSIYPPGYHCNPSQPLPYVGLASQKNHMGIYLFGVYSSESEQRWFREAWLKTGKKLDMGKSCVRFKKIDDVALDVIGKTIKRTPARKFIAYYESAIGPRRRPTKKKSKVTRAPARKTAKKTGKATARKVSKITARGPTKKRITKRAT
ncbi:MAG: DUF1801 domain-containing protein [Planctomycetota bacterium]|nr:DUF1801 domain-containing protein [Planctomycetota bacterium]